ncbi:MAG TPA: DUF1801 domain-containing protein [Thermomicrobiaceae bacterium]|nr:DUF1801 domain-containing protein [Thermomicrobiaceae bacterium]
MAGTDAMPAEESPARQIDAIIRQSGDWRGARLARLRAVIAEADPAAVEEVKWKKPSRPEGVPVWSHGGIVCIGEMLKRAVRLTFPQGARLADPAGLFNARLDSAKTRAIDVHEQDAVDEAALAALVREAAAVNKGARG